MHMTCIKNELLTSRHDCVFVVTIVIIWIYTKYWLVALHIRYTVPSTEGFHIPAGHYTVQNLLISPWEIIGFVLDYV